MSRLLQLFGVKSSNNASSSRWEMITVGIFIIGLIAFLRTEVKSVTSSVKEIHMKSSRTERRTYERKPYDKNILSDTSCARLKDLKKEILQANQAIWKDWEVSSYPNFLKLMHVPSLSWQLQKLKFISLLTKAFQVEGYAEPKDFVIGFSGSSVTAGHGKRISPFNEQKYR
jgi:predicted HTH transcriptional regulator